MCEIRFSGVTERLRVRVSICVSAWLVIYITKNCADIDDCVSTPCQHDGTCTDLENGYKCSCAAGYTGVECEIGSVANRVLWVGWYMWLSDWATISVCVSICIWRDRSYWQFAWFNIVQWGDSTIVTLPCHCRGPTNEVPYILIRCRLLGFVLAPLTNVSMNRDNGKFNRSYTDDNIVEKSYFFGGCYTTQVHLHWRIQRGVAGVATPPLVFKKRGHQRGRCDNHGVYSEWTWRRRDVGKSVPALMDLLYISRSSAIRPTIHSQVHHNVTTSFSQYLWSSSVSLALHFSFSGLCCILEIPLEIAVLLTVDL